jgi:hypothetical protein
MTMRMRTRFLITLALGLLITACCPKPPLTLSEAQRNRARQLALYRVAWHQEHPCSASASDRPVRVADAENPKTVNGLTSTQADEGEEGVTCQQ